VDSEADYLLIPQGYAAWLGGLHWSAAGDAIEDEAQATFALAPQIALFLEGFGGKAPHFAHVLHMLHLLGLGGRRQRPHEATPLEWGFRTLGRPLRNAGALCAHLCRDMPPSRPADMKEVCGLLWSSLQMAEVVSRWSLRTAFHLSTSMEEPALGATAFERRFFQAHDALSPEESLYWLQHGGPSEGRAITPIVEAIPPTKPRTLGEILDDLAERKRLGGALPYVAQMVSALSLPPRRRHHSELPIGGYSDVTTRGHPEQLLPSQFAVEDLEFVRRFAQNELLYFRREEPTSQVREELLLLLDQGVRAWGTVRLLLAAAALAFGRLAQRRKLPLLLAGTSNGGVPLPVLDARPEVLNRLVDASDLSLNPGLALERVLDAPADGLRDIVLLTHPRALLEEDVLAAARRAGPETRLFALGVNDRGQVQLSELRHGVPVALAQFVVDLNAKPMPVPTVTAVRGPLAPTSWTGCIEPIGFPFRLGMVSPIEKFAFDHDGTHLLTVSQNGMLHLWAVDGTLMEVLPRPIEGKSPGALVTVVGVTRGFVIASRFSVGPRIHFYDLTRRRCRQLPLALDLGLEWEWYYVATHNTIVAQRGEVIQGVDLDTDLNYLPGYPTQPTDRVRQACEWAATHALAPSAGPTIMALDSTDGILSVGDATLTPLSDGKPALVKHRLLQARRTGDVVAAMLINPSRAANLHVYRTDGTPLAIFECKHSDFALSADGRYLARQSAANQVIVHEIQRSPAPVFVTAKGRCHQDLYVEQGHLKMVVQIGNWVHLVRWDRGPLEMVHGQGDRQEFLRKHLGGVEPRFPGKATRLPAMAYDNTRFRYAVEGEIDVIVDVFGQISVLDRAGTLVAMFFVFRNNIAVWMPDGTRHGPASIVGGPSTEGSLEAVGRALREACTRGQGRNA
jgi:hypothetical protein